MKLNFISIPVNWYVLYPNDHCVNFVHTEIVNHTVSANMYLNIDTAAFVFGKNISLSLHGMNNIRQVEPIVSEIALIFTHNGSDSKRSFHLTRAKEHIKEIINDLSLVNNCDESTSTKFPNLGRLQFIMCQLENCFIPKTRRRYNVITQIIALKTHLISPSCYN